jgi:hypothetical protein
MTSSYKYKGTPIDKIINTANGDSTNSDTFHNVYDGLPNTYSSTFNNSKLINVLNYKLTQGTTNTDLSSICSAYHHKYNEAIGDTDIPTNVKACRYFIIGGSGGGGGGGGVGNSSGVQGNGGTGGYGQVGFSNSSDDTVNHINIDRNNENTFSIVSIGSAGAGGGHGTAEWGNGGNSAGNAGSSGKSGTETKIIIGGESYNAAGGNGGGAGGGGWAYQTNSLFANNNASNGVWGVRPQPNNMISTNWDKSYVTPETGGASGAGGNNISDGGAAGKGGEPGYAVIVWLYD